MCLVGPAVTIILLAGRWPYVVLGIDDPGQLVRLGAPLLRLTADGAATVCVGSLAYAVFFTDRQPSGLVSPRGYAALVTAGRWAIVWLMAVLLLVPFDAAASAGLPLRRVLSVPALVTLTGALESTKAWLVTAGLVAVVAAGCRLTLRWRPACALLAVAVFAVLPPLATGHSSSDTGHDLATAAIMIHVPAAVVWLGVLIAIARNWPRHAADVAVLSRYRRLAAGCWCVLAGSGLVDALVLVSPSAWLHSGYGLIQVATIVAVVALGLLGVRLRRYGTSPGRSRTALGLVVSELLILGATFGVSVAATALPPPAFIDTPVSGDQTLLGYNLPDPPTMLRLAFDWRIEVFFGPFAVLLAIVYMIGVYRVHHGGGHWPLPHGIAWLAGCGVLLIATCSGLGRYAPAMFSVQMASHMLVGMLAPTLLALGAPATLAAEALPAAPTGALSGPREWLAGIGGGSAVRWLTQPLVGVVLFVGAPFLLYFTPLFDAVTRFHWAHMAVDGCFLVIGYMFAWLAVGVDRLPRPMPVLARLGLILAAMPFDIVFGAAVIGTGRIIGDGAAGANMYSALALPWVHLHADQRIGGIIALVAAETTLLAMLTVLLWRWHHIDLTDDPAATDLRAALLAHRDAGSRSAAVSHPAGGESA